MGFFPPLRPDWPGSSGKRIGRVCGKLQVKASMGTKIYPSKTNLMYASGRKKIRFMNSQVYNSPLDLLQRFGNHRISREGPHILSCLGPREVAHPAQGKSRDLYRQKGCLKIQLMSHRTKPRWVQNFRQYIY